MSKLRDYDLILSVLLNYEGQSMVKPVVNRKDAPHQHDATDKDNCRFKGALILNKIAIEYQHNHRQQRYKISGLDAGNAGLPQGCAVNVQSRSD